MLSCAYKVDTVTDKGLCFFEPILQAGAERGTVSFREIRIAARALLQQCGNEQRQGGIVTNIGMSSTHSSERGEDVVRIKRSNTIW